MRKIRFRTLIVFSVLSLFVSLSSSAVLAASAWPYYEAAERAEKAGNYAEAVALYSKSIVAEPVQVWMTYNQRGCCYKKLGESQKAIDDFTKAIELQPAYATSYYNRALLYKQTGDWSKAVDDFSKSLVFEPNSPETYTNRAIAYDHLGERPKALEDFDKALTINPGFFSALKYRAQLYEKSGEIEKALTGFDKCIAIAQDPECVSMRAACEKLVNEKNSPVKDKWALVVGISKFATPGHDLQYAAKDAQDFSNYLINEANFKKDHVMVLLNEKATRANVMEAFGDQFLPAVTQPGDLVVIFVSTHGTPARKDKGGRNYIVAYDTDANKLYGTGVDMDELYKRLKNEVKTDRLLIVMDTCYSGGGVPGAKGEHAPANFDASEIAQGSGHLVISSSSPDQRSWESRASQNGVFTKYLLETLRTRNGKIDVKTAFADVQKKVGWEVQNAFGEKQTPQLGGKWEGKELILSVPAVEPRPNLSPDLIKLMQGGY